MPVESLESKLQYDILIIIFDGQTLEICAKQSEKYT